MLKDIDFKKVVDTAVAVIPEEVEGGEGEVGLERGLDMFEVMMNTS